MPEDVQQRQAPSGDVCLAILQQDCPAPECIKLGLPLELALMGLGQR
jgi:hypothetical protein